MTKKIKIILLSTSLLMPSVAFSNSPQPNFSFLSAISFCKKVSDNIKIIQDETPGVYSFQDGQSISSLASTGACDSGLAQNVPSLSVSEAESKLADQLHENNSKSLPNGDPIPSEYILSEWHYEPHVKRQIARSYNRCVIKAPQFCRKLLISAFKHNPDVLEPYKK